MTDELLNLTDERFEICDGNLLEYRGNDRVVVIPEGVISIARHVFENAFNTEAICLPRSIRSISCPFDPYNISFKYRLREVHVPDIETWLGIDFADQFSNFLSVHNGLNPEGGNLPPELFVGEAPLVDLVVPEGVKSVKKYSFSNCGTLRSLVIGNGVEEIGKGAFCNCVNLESAILPQKGCRLAPYLGVSDGIFDGCEKLTAVELPEDLTEIPACMFSGCKSLKSIKLPEGITSIGRRAIDITAMERIELPDTLEKLGMYALSFAPWVSPADYGKAFNVYGGACYLGSARNPYMVLMKAENEEITACDVAAGTKFIMSSAFSGCKELREVSIPGSVKRIGEDAFGDCRKLKNVSIENFECDIAEDAFDGCDSFDRPVLGNTGIAVKTVGYSSGNAAGNSAGSFAGEKVFILTAEKQWCYRRYAGADGNVRETLASRSEHMSVLNDELIWGLLSLLQSRNCETGMNGYIRFDPRDYGGINKIGRKNIIELSAELRPLPAGDEIHRFVNAFFPEAGEPGDSVELDRTVCAEITARFEGYPERELSKASLRAVFEQDVLTYEGIRLYRELLKKGRGRRDVPVEQEWGAGDGQEFFPF